jgi:hypothetical protein
MQNRNREVSDAEHCTTSANTTVLERFPAGAPRGSWPAEEFAAARRNEGQPAEVVMNLAADAFLVIVKKVA